MEIQDIDRILLVASHYIFAVPPAYGSPPSGQPGVHMSTVQFLCLSPGNIPSCALPLGNLEATAPTALGGEE
ncbi:hypothetical protein NKR23_g7485 [Pleurostoma richardsiae]|uniref:Uncharacterized protein n=1 Tax=Pleurostoma richardsiae TaxID=41990 RepID=A0AA38RI15_9PEZI|nr:hypothetical protein NKR23_g7485 [Pleurostoma richardsiae]